MFKPHTDLRGERKLKNTFIELECRAAVEINFVLLPLFS